MEKFYNDFINFFVNNLRNEFKFELGIPFFLNDETFSAEYIASLDFYGGPNGTFHLFIPSAFYSENFKTTDELTECIVGALNVSETQFREFEFSKVYISRNELSSDMINDAKASVVYPLFVNSKKVLAVITVSSEDE